VTGTMNDTVAVDRELVRQVRRQVGAELTEQRRRYRASGQPLTGEDERALAKSLIDEQVRHYGAEQLASSVVVPVAQLETLGREVWAALYEADRLQSLLNDDEVETIDINGYERMFVKRADKPRERVRSLIAGSDEELIDLVRGLAAWAGLASRPWDPSNPLLRLRLPDGSRLSAIAWVCERPSVSIRRNRYPRISLEDMVTLGTCSPAVAEFLRAAIRARLTIFFAGDQSVGKTAMLRACAREIDPDERICTVEESLELDLAALGIHDDVVALEAREAYGDAGGDVSLATLVRATLTQNADRVIVGECKGPEIVALIHATLSGSGGSLSTVHCKEAKGVFNRIASLAAEYAEIPSAVAHMLMAEALELVVYLRVVRDPVTGSRRRVVDEIVQVDGFTGDVVTSSTLFKYDPATGIAEPQPALNNCLFVDQLTEVGWRQQTTAHSGWQL
jgi:pilus assembly protein CpaF